MHSIEKDIDSLGRVVIPSRFRKKLGITQNSTVLVSVEDGDIIISPIERYCALCGEAISEKKEIRLCRSCIDLVKFKG